MPKVANFSDIIKFWSCSSKRSLKPQYVSNKLKTCAEIQLWLLFFDLSKNVDIWKKAMYGRAVSS